MKTSLALVTAVAALALLPQPSAAADECSSFTLRASAQPPAYPTGPIVEQYSYTASGCFGVVITAQSAVRCDGHIYLAAEVVSGPSGGLTATAGNGISCSSCLETWTAYIDVSFVG